MFLFLFCFYFRTVSTAAITKYKTYCERHWVCVRFETKAIISIRCPDIELPLSCLSALPKTKNKKTKSNNKKEEQTQRRRRKVEQIKLNHKQQQTHPERTQIRVPLINIHSIHNTTHTNKSSAGTHTILRRKRGIEHQLMLVNISLRLRKPTGNAWCVYSQ